MKDSYELIEQKSAPIRLSVWIVFISMLIQIQSVVKELLTRLYRTNKITLVIFQFLISSLIQLQGVKNAANMFKGNVPFTNQHGLNRLMLSGHFRRKYVCVLLAFPNTCTAHALQNKCHVEHGLVHTKEDGCCQPRSQKTKIILMFGR